MNAVGRRWICGPFLLALLSAAITTPAHSEELQSQLGAEIEQRFEESTIEVNTAPFEFGFDFSKYVASRAHVFVNKFNPGWIILPRLHGTPRLEEPASLPQPTLVERYIAKGFPSGELSRDARVQDDSYLFAREECTFGGMRFSR